MVTTFVVPTFRTVRLCSSCPKLASSIRTGPGRDPNPRQPVVELDGDDLHPAERGGGLRGERACRRDEREQEAEALHRRSGTRPNDFACGMTAAASVDNHCSSTEL